jgi:hypothetical protein
MFSAADVTAIVVAYNSAAMLPAHAVFSLIWL